MSLFPMFSVSLVFSRLQLQNLLYFGPLMTWQEDELPFSLRLYCKIAALPSARGCYGQDFFTVYILQCFDYLRYLAKRRGQGRLQLEQGGYGWRRPREENKHRLPGGAFAFVHVYLDKDVTFFRDNQGLQGDFRVFFVCLRRKNEMPTSTVYRPAA